MADEKIPLNMENIPPRTKGEEPITEKQIKYIVHLTGCTSRAIDHLGKWQASELIDSILEEQEENHDIDKAIRRTGRTKKNKQGCSLSGLILLAVLCFLIWIPFCKSGDKDPAPLQPTKQETTKEPDKRREIIVPQPQQPVAPIVPEKPKSIAEEPIDRTDGIILTLEGLALPAELLVLSPLELKDTSGQETEIPTDTKIEVLDRSEFGTLTLKIADKIFIGNESRLRAKVRIIAK